MSCHLCGAHPDSKSNSTSQLFKCSCGRLSCKRHATQRTYGLGQKCPTCGSIQIKPYEDKTFKKFGHNVGISGGGFKGGGLASLDGGEGWDAKKSFEKHEAKRKEKLNADRKRRREHMLNEGAENARPDAEKSKLQQGLETMQNRVENFFGISLSSNTSTLSNAAISGTQAFDKRRGGQTYEGDEPYEKTPEELEQEHLKREQEEAEKRQHLSQAAILGVQAINLGYTPERADQPPSMTDALQQEYGVVLPAASAQKNPQETEHSHQTTEDEASESPETKPTTETRERGAINRLNVTQAVLHSAGKVQKVNPLTGETEEAPEGDAAVAVSGKTTQQVASEDQPKAPQNPLKREEEDMPQIVIVSACRTAIGTFNGSLKDMPATTLGSTVIAEALKRAKVSPEHVSETIMGQVLQSGCGQNPARQAAMGAGIPNTAPAHTLNMVCGSGLKSIMAGVASIQTGQASIVVAGGMENMSQAPHLVHLRNGTKMGDDALVDSMVLDGLWDAFNDYHMGQTAENIATQFNISREAQDLFAHGSQTKAKEAIVSGAFSAEIVPVPVPIPQRKGEPVPFDTDEHPRLAALEKLATLRPAFVQNGTVTAANASGLNDGAAAVVLMTAEEAAHRGLQPLATIESMAQTGVAPDIMGTAPISASQKALEQAGWHMNEVDLVEANEAFAAQALCVQQQLNIPDEKLNVYGGAIALGHPIGASGTRCVVTLLHAMQERQAKKGLVTLCIGGGMGVALCLAR